MLKIIYLTFLSSLLFSSLAHGQIGKRTGKLSFERLTVGTTAQAVTAAAQKKVYGWQVCHEVGSAAAYISLSNGADPDVDGIRLGPGACFDCPNCGVGALEKLRIKSAAAATPYSVLQKLP